MGKLLTIAEGCVVMSSEIACLIADPPGGRGRIYLRMKDGFSMLIPPDEGKTPLDEVKRLKTAVGLLCQ